MGTWAHNTVGPEIWIGPEADDLRGTTPSGELEITENGEYDVTQYATADVQVAGGSSDFSIAEVTFNVTPPEGVTLVQVETNEVMFLFYTSDLSGGTDVYYSATYPINMSEALVIPVPVYGNNPTKFGAMIGFIDNTDDYYLFDGLPTITGNATYDSDNECYLITGDCTLSGPIISDK